MNLTDVDCNIYRFAGGITVHLTQEVQWSRGGATFFGEKGKVVINRSKMTSDPVELADDYLKEHAAYRLPSHETDWINCIYGGNTPIGELETGIRTAGICRILNIARYAGRSLKWEPAKEEFIGGSEADTWLRREHRKGFEV